MMNRRLRGVLGMATIWSVAAALLCLPLVVWPIYDRLAFHDPIYPWRQIRQLALPIMRNYAVVGAIVGSVFALVLARLARRVRSVDALSMRQAALGGALGGLTLPLIVLVLVLAGGGPLTHLGAELLIVIGRWAAVGSTVGAALAAGTLAVARHAPRPPDGTPSLAASVPSGNRVSSGARSGLNAG